MENMDRKYLMELFKLGVIIPETVQMYLDILNQSSDLNQTSKEKFTGSLEEYYKAVVKDEEKLKQLCSTVIGICHKALTTSQEKLMKLIRIKREFYLRTSLYYRMRKWKLASFKLAISSYRNSEGWTNKTTIVSARTKKENEELKECTFQPAVNTSTSTRNSRHKTYSSSLIERSVNNPSVYARLYSDYIRMNLKKEIKRNETEIQLGISASFLPKTGSTPKIYQSLSSRSFSERITSYRENKQSRRNKLEQHLEETYRKEYTFTPITNKRSYYSLTKPHHVTDHIKKTNQYDVYSANQKGKAYRPLDLKRLESLYLSYKERKNKIRNIQAEADKEGGYTYQPFLNYNETDKYKLRIDKNILERNEQFIQAKKDNISKATESHFGYQQPKHSYSVEEKNQITQNIINRLYCNGLERTLTRNNLTLNTSPKNKYLPTASSQPQENFVSTNEEYSDKLISLEAYQQKKESTGHQINELI